MTMRNTKETVPEFVKGISYLPPCVNPQKNAVNEFIFWFLAIDKSYPILSRIF